MRSMSLFFISADLQGLCMVQAVSVTTCSTTDLACLCTNSAYISKAIHCIASTCSATDAQNSYQYATFACANAGVTVPSVESVLDPGGSSSSSSATPSDPPATSPAAAASPAAVSSSSSAYTPATAPYPTSSAVASKAGNTTSSSPVVIFKGFAPKNGIEKGLISAVALTVVAILGAGLL